MEQDLSSGMEQELIPTPPPGKGAEFRDGAGPDPEISYRERLGMEQDLIPESPPGKGELSSGMEQDLIPKSPRKGAELRDGAGADPEISSRERS
ncbi:hypothetical protein HGM15179_015851 [Zosterops borbonicus]|uniref:Uncharacterized protein n=1 Tax=Zosterops borbonicus TaxID=364589 RepID=A0A8K1LEV9_9PASS|nr:hypothetical protein HGM15179_015851 [Zosterops borbonicus]